MKKNSSNENNDYWEYFYEKVNPWGNDGILRDLIRIKIVNECFNNYFKNGIDIACGGVLLVAKLYKKGFDISKTAIERAQKNTKI